MNSHENHYWPAEFHTPITQDEVIAHDEFFSQEKVNALVTPKEVPSAVDATWNEITPELEELANKWGEGPQKILNTLEKFEPVVAEFNSDIKNIVTSLKQFIESQNPSFLNQTLFDSLTRLLPSLLSEERQYAHTLLNIQTTKGTIYIEDIVLASEKLHSILSTPHNQWKTLAHSQLSPELTLTENVRASEDISYLDEISFWLKLQDVLKITENKLSELPLSKKQKSLLRAKAISSTIPEYSAFLSPSISLDLMEGRFDFNDPWLKDRVVFLFIELGEVLESQEKEPEPKREGRERKLLLSKKQLIMLAIAVILGASITSYINRPEVPFFEPDTSTTEQPAETEAPQEMPQMRDSSSPENSGEFPSGSAWRIEGTVPSGYFRTSTASTFYSNPLWDFDSTGGFTLTNINTMPESVETTLVSTLEISRPGFYSIPAPYGGYYPATVELEGAIYRVVSKDNGTFLLVVESIDTPQLITIGFARGDVNYNPDAPIDEQYDASALLPDISTLPTEAQDAITAASGMPVEQGANHLRNFVRNYFIYSIDPSHSNYHRAETGRGEFVTRAFARPFADCDVVNTALVASLRAAGIPARMVYGYANSDGFLDPSRGSLDNAESHGWVEYYNGSEWVMLDATPTRVDDYTAQRLDMLNGGGGIEDIISMLDLNTIRQFIMYGLLDIGDWFRNYGVLVSVLSIIAGPIGVASVNSYVGHRQRGKISKMRDTLIEQRKGLYTSDADQRMIVELVYDNVEKDYWHEKNYSGKVWFADMVSGVPMALTNLERGRRIKKAEKAMASTNPGLYNDELFFAFITESLGIKPEKAANKIINLNSEFLSGTCLNSHNKRMSSLMRKTWDGFTFMAKDQKYSNVADFILPICKKSADFEDFLQKVMENYYEGYVNQWHKYKPSRMKIRNAKTPQQKFHNLMGREQFANIFYPAFTPLTYLWEHHEAKKKAKQELSELFNQQEVDTNIPSHRITTPPTEYPT